MPPSAATPLRLPLPDPPPAVAPVVPPARAHARHWLLALSFLLLVVLPILVSAWYLWTRAADRYVSQLAFAVQADQPALPTDLLGGLTVLTGTPDSDVEALYQYIRSPALVAQIDARLDLRRLWTEPGTGWRGDPVFAYHGPGTIEDLTDYWRRRVHLQVDDTAGIIAVSAEAFDPAQARAIATAIHDEALKMINALSDRAQRDATRLTLSERNAARLRLDKARAALTAFRNRTRIVDPAATLQGHIGLLTGLQSQMAELSIDLDLLRQSATPQDPRLLQTERRLKAVRQRILQESAMLAAGDRSSRETEALAPLLGEYEGLLADRSLAEAAYTAAVAAHEVALAEARRQSRYLNAHVRPTLPEGAREPARVTLLGLIALFCTLGWAALVLVAYAVRDRR